jgi:hypothetical protein
MEAYDFPAKDIDLIRRMYSKSFFTVLHWRAGCMDSITLNGTSFTQLPPDAAHKHLGVRMTMTGCFQAEKKKKIETTRVKKDMTDPKSENCSSDLGNLSDIKGKSLNDEDIYRILLERMGNYCAANIRYSVQIGAYKHPAKFKTDKLKDLGKISSAAYPDSLTRFIQNEFITLNVAEKTRQKLIARGLKDAWIVAFIGGKRYTLEDLILVDFLGRPIN